MRPALLALLLLAACGPGLDLRDLAGPGEAGRRGAVEIAVKGAFPQVLGDIAAGGGPALEAAFDAAGVPEGDRAARTLQLGGDLGLYEANPGALATAIALMG